MQIRCCSLDSGFAVSWLCSSATLSPWVASLGRSSAYRRHASEPQHGRHTAHRFTLVCERLSCTAVALDRQRRYFFFPTMLLWASTELRHAGWRTWTALMRGSSRRRHAHSATPSDANRGRLSKSNESKMAYGVETVKVLTVLRTRACGVVRAYACVPLRRLVCAFFSELFCLRSCGPQPFQERLARSQGRAPLKSLASPGSMSARGPASHRRDR